MEQPARELFQDPTIQRLAECAIGFLFLIKSLNQFDGDVIEPGEVGVLPATAAIESRFFLLLIWKEQSPTGPVESKRQPANAQTPNRDPG